MPEDDEAAPPPPPSPLPSSYNDDDLSIFHPSRHEGLHPQIDPPSTSSPPRPQELMAVPDEEEEGLHRWRRRGEQLLVSAKCLIGSGMEFIQSKMPSCRRGGGGGGGGAMGLCFAGGAVWSFAALAGLVGAFLYLRRRHWREKAMLLLLQEKDQKIRLLLHQIAQMNDARHRVPVLSA